MSRKLDKRALEWAENNVNRRIEARNFNNTLLEQYDQLLETTQELKKQLDTLHLKLTE